jgi:hypothetical protein
MQNGNIYMNWIPILISALLSGLIGVGISTWYHQRNEIKRIKLHVLQQLLGNRNDIQGQPFAEALNQVIVVFHDSKDVLKAWGAFFEAVAHHETNDLIFSKLLDLFKAMCRDLNIKTEQLTDDFFLRAYNVRPHRF